MPKVDRNPEYSKLIVKGKTFNMAEHEEDLAGIFEHGIVNIITMTAEPPISLTRRIAVFAAVIGAVLREMDHTIKQHRDAGCESHTCGWGEASVEEELVETFRNNFAHGENVVEQEYSKMHADTRALTLEMLDKAAKGQKQE